MKLILNSHRQTAKILLGYHNHIIQNVYINYCLQHLHLSTGTIPYIDTLRMFITFGKKRKKRNKQKKETKKETKEIKR